MRKSDTRIPGWFVLWALVGVAVWAVIIYVAAHFIGKYW